MKFINKVLFTIAFCVLWSLGNDAEAAKPKEAPAASAESRAEKFKSIVVTFTAPMTEEALEAHRRGYESLARAVYHQSARAELIPVAFPGALARTIVVHWDD